MALSFTEVQNIVTKNSQQCSDTHVNLTAFYIELNKLGKNGDYSRAIKVAKKNFLNVLIYDSYEIDIADAQATLSSRICYVRLLNPCSNTLSSLTIINKIITCLPKLNFLNLSYNLLGRENVNSIPPTLYPSLKKLVLNHVGIHWSVLVPYLEFAPNLEELHLSFNQMEIPSSDNDCKKNNLVLPKITTLHFDGNRVEHREHLQWISEVFPSLTSLVLCDCPLWTLRWKSSPTIIRDGEKRMSGGSLGSYSSSAETSSYATCSGNGKSPCCGVLVDDLCKERSDDEGASSSFFLHLRSISINNSFLECWEEVDYLREWPSLVELRLQSCPLFCKLTEHERRQLTIARLPNLRRLNGGCDIGHKEREESERNFIRRFNNFETKPKRYEELVNQHGNVAPFAEVSLSPPKVVNVWVRYGEQRWNEKNLSLHMTMKELRERFSYVVGLPASKLRIWHFDHTFQHGFGRVRFSTWLWYMYILQCVISIHISQLDSKDYLIIIASLKMDITQLTEENNYLRNKIYGSNTLSLNNNGTGQKRMADTEATREGYHRAPENHNNNNGELSNIFTAKQLKMDIVNNDEPLLQVNPIAKKETTETGDAFVSHCKYWYYYWGSK
nr:EOG090X05JJ [Eurycercus lamellatus]